MSTKSGQEAEELAAGYLEEQGLKIIQRNYRDRWAEIDIIARDKQVIHFIEVKFRQSDLAGTGLDYITTGKIRRLKNAAAMWVGKHYPGEAYQIDIISIDGTQITYLPNAIQG